ncbi:MAG: phospholipase [Gemmatimonadota bacterium]|nr:phospholipase [Gemmatimonadota bacterium]
MTQHSIVVPRTARYYTLGPTHGFPRELWIVCHGYGQLAARFISHFAPLDDGTRLIVAPEALSRFYLDPLPERRGQRDPRVGATWMTREDRLDEIGDYVGYLDLVAGEVRHHLTGASPRIVVLGFSQGTATVSRWLAESDLRADHLVLWSGGIPPELDLAHWAGTLRGAAISLVAGDADEMVTPEAIAHEAERLSSAGVAFHVHKFEGGHTIDAGALAALAEGFQRS